MSLAKPDVLKALAGVWIRLPREVFLDLRHTVRLWVNRPWQAGFAIAALAKDGLPLIKKADALLYLGPPEKLTLHSLQAGVSNRRIFRNSTGGQ